MESLADNNNECEQNKGITTFLSGNKNLFRRDANGQFRRTFFFVTPKISNRAETTVFAASAAHIARKENCAKITNHVIKDLNFHRLEAGIWFPSSSDFAALRRTESQRLANLSGNSFLNKSDIFQDKLRKIKNKTDWYLQSWPTPSQVLEYSKYVFQLISEGVWDEREFFQSFSHGMKIYDPNWRWRHETDNTNQAVNSRHHFFLLPRIVDLLRYNEDNFRWGPFIGESETNKANRLLRDKIVSRLIDNIQNEVPLMYESEDQLENGIEAEFDGFVAGAEFGRLSQHYGTLRAIPAANQLHDLEISLQASHETEAKFYSKRSEKQPRQTSWKGESSEFFPYFWSSIFEGNCNNESVLSMNLTSGHRLVPPIQRYMSDALINNDVDPPHCYAAALYPKDDKLASISLHAQSFALCLGKNRTAALVSRTEYCQKIPAAPQGRRSCVTEGLPPCPECLR